VTPLRFSVGVSLGVHIAVAGAVMWFGAGLRAVQLPSSDREQSIELTLVTIPEETVVDPRPDTQVGPREPSASEALQQTASATTAPEEPASEPVQPPVEPRPPSEPLPTEKSGPTPLEPLAEPSDSTPRAKNLEAAGPSPMAEVFAAAKSAAVAATGPGPTTVPEQHGSANPGTEAVSSKPMFILRAEPDYRKNPELPYPAAARRRRQEGVVLLDVKVSAQGRPLRVELKHSSGIQILDEAALTAVRTWEFQPARAGLNPVESDVEVPVRFRLAD
jgi:protein TonB